MRNGDRPGQQTDSADYGPMPAILDDADWATWLGEADVASEQAKSVLRTVEGVNWKMEREPKPAKPTAGPRPERPMLF